MLGAGLLFGTMRVSLIYPADRQMDRCAGKGQGTFNNDDCDNKKQKISRTWTPQECIQNGVNDQIYVEWNREFA